MSNDLYSRYMGGLNQGNQGSFPVGLGTHNNMPTNLGGSNFTLQQPNLNQSFDFGMNTGTMDMLGTGIQGLSGLASMYFGNKQLGLAEDQYNTNKEFSNRNLANQATTVNNSLEARYRAALAAQGKGTQGSQGESLQGYLDRSKVDGSAIS